MPAFEGEGGKKRKRTRKPASSAGIALKEALELESQHALISQPTQPNSSDEFRQPEHLSPQFQLHTVENLAHDNNPEPQSPTPNSTTDPQVTSLLDYFRSENYKKKRDLEEKHWAEVYPGMFSWFSQCATKTSDWGNEDVWNHDWKERCACNHTRTRHVVLVDLLRRKQEPVDFCECQTDQVRLIQMGYIGGSPKFPKTAFSIRLLQFHHVLWKYSSVAVTPFSKALDEFLDSNSPLILVNHHVSNEENLHSTRKWRRTLTSAIDAYREMLRRDELLSEEMLSTGPMDQMADICPKCFGPPVPGKEESEPDYIVCMDGNFQHRRHLAASIENSTLKTPHLFIQPDEVKDMQTSMQNQMESNQANVNVDPCSEQHTAANDIQGASTWAACDDTGIFGLACRHDQLLQMINIVQSGEKAYYPMTMIKHLLSKTDTDGNDPKKIGFLYDIGCNIEKGIIRRNQFALERNNNQLMFGTSVFHSYVHEWSCQLRYNPRLNVGWGFSDGEGLERIWAYLSPLISQLRYSTKNHRLTALDLRSDHHNKLGRFNALKLLLERGKSIEKVMKASKANLNQITNEHGHSVQYLQEQWLRQRECQLSVMETDTERNLKAHVEELVELEDQLREAHEKMVSLQRSRRRNQTEAERIEIENLPNTLVLLEEEIEKVVQELGSEAFRNLPGSSDEETKLLIKLKISKAKLYEAKVGVSETQKKWDQPQSGW
ncbi:uncharacterized protein PGTG_14679 [Puccinia graminis f. sp. tritici CRL 75-36-700-3]|uniref:CxC1-like cysteine cluster associated with KDZ transposases domain-containing protein n=1 Tax=Puccinia graminis f. sp. tritici (strain CRL 75-36-700-3 / race SCCL) TaxID=418459 RepID=E3KWP6_PUCGT|nr:uncharacterized protein PGTG_14679 [Puccinia graminis f. sp. tritici CRL 75-36-700-3]EFP88713.2 hypothetical protein PGTG_14679 [Puccinia graminis f. sp. tritici CRL 75-36-700-3]